MGRRSPDLEMQNGIEKSYENLGVVIYCQAAVNVKSYKIYFLFPTKSPKETVQQRAEYQTVKDELAA